MLLESQKLFESIFKEARLPDGLFTVLEHVKSGQPTYDDELFGPVASLIKAKYDEDAMRIANDSGLDLVTQFFQKM